MKRGRWFVPEVPDVIGLLREQLAIAIEGIAGLRAWCEGDRSAGEAVAAAERHGDVVKRRLLEALRVALVVPLEPEDAFALSRGIDRTLEQARDLVSEARVMDVEPDERMAAMAAHVIDALREIDRALGSLASDGDQVIARADAALEAAGELRATYYDGMAALLEVSSERERISRRELYRRCIGLADPLVEVAERVVYAVVKES
jgi:uncharacterized protein Yka (UPF0111/DUF47 family)